VFASNSLRRVASGALLNASHAASAFALLYGSFSSRLAADSAFILSGPNRSAKTGLIVSLEFLSTSRWMTVSASTLAKAVTVLPLYSAVTR